MSLKNDDFPAIAEVCQKSDFGKRLPHAITSMQIFLSKITG